MSYSTSTRVNLLQNKLDFELDLSNLLIIFQRGLFTKVLNPLNSNLKENRIVIVKCTQKGYK